jgi:Bacteriophage minor capsid protein
MKIQDVITYIESLVDYTYYPFSFPRTSNDGVASVKVGAGPPKDEDTGVSFPTIQILVRGRPRDYDSAESKAHELFNALANKKETRIGDASVVVIRPNGSSPIFIGLDENERPIFSINFNTVIRP